MPKNPKLLGERAECAFVLAALEHGLAVAKPWGDSQPYDAIVDNGRRLFRVQVRSAVFRKGGYTVNTAHTSKRRIYTSAEVDILAAWVEPAPTWYLIPVSEIGTAMALWLNPMSKRARWEKYREAWEAVFDIANSINGLTSCQANK